MNTPEHPMVNLIPQEHAHQRQCRRWMSWWGVAIVSTATVIGIPGVYIGGSAALIDPGISDQIAEANMEYARHQQAIPVLRAQLAELAAEQEVLELVENRIEWRTVFAVLIETAQSDVRFHRISASGGGIEGDSPIRIYIEGLAPTQTIARGYVVDLEGVNIFDSVELIETTREQMNDVELIRFRVEITVLGAQAERQEVRDAG